MVFSMSDSPDICDADLPLSRLLDAIAAKKPTPGGGAVAACAGALAAAMGEMVLAYSVGRRATAEHDELHRAAAAELAAVRSNLLDLMVADQRAFAALQAIPAGSDKSAAVAACVDVPQRIATAGVEMLKAARRVAPTANPYLLSDLAVCCELAMATVRAALCSVRVNLPDLPDADRLRARDAADATLAGGVALVREAVPEIESRMSAPS